LKHVDFFGGGLDSLGVGLVRYGKDQRGGGYDYKGDAAKFGETFRVHTFL
jgi:hypothetical protein